MKRVLLEPTWKLHSVFDSLRACPPPGYEFVVVEGAIEKGIGIASKWEPFYWFLAQASRVAPVALLRSLAARVGSRPKDVCLTYATGHVVLRKEPWILDMFGDPPSILSGVNESFPRALWAAIVRRILASGYCRKIVVRFRVHEEEFLSYFGDERLAHKLQVVYWGVPKKDFVKEYDENRVRLLFVNSSNFNQAEHFALKGGHELLAAFSELSRRYDNLELVVRSGVPPRVRAELRDNKKVRLIDQPVPWHELEREWRSADIFVLPTWVTPAQGLLDALSYELPIVTTDVGGNSEIVEDGKTGFLAPRRTATPVDRELAESLCQKLSILVENPELRRTMGKEARRIAEEKFSIDRRNECLRGILDEATNKEAEWCGRAGQA
jgi:glycosyltransferase involved in cell wall biosynthesis